MDYNKTINLPKTEFPMRAGLPKREPEMLQRWNDMDLYNELLKKNEGKPRFALHDGPPFSNGNLHMGHALNKSIKDFITRAAAMRGAEVTLIHGQTALPPVKFTTDVPVTTARQMYEAVTSRFDTTDVLIMAAAVADYRPATVANDKIKKKEGDLSIPVERTEDILGTIGPRKTHQFLCGFSMETRDLVENSSAKLAKKNLDMVVANNLKVAGAGFGVDTNVVTFITPDGTRELPLMSKADVADAILDEILRRRAK